MFPHEIVKEKLQFNAVEVISSHYHPSNDPKPSGADKALSLLFEEALVDVHTLDHIIVTGDATASLAERGLL